MFGSRKNRTSRSVSQAAHQSRPTFEMLEERQHFSVYTVTNTNDSGTGSLRAAMQAVNAGKDSVIKFNISQSSHGYSSGTKTWTINLNSALPVLEKSVMIDGYSQPGYKSSPVVKLNGQGLEFEAPHSTLRGIAINDAKDGVSLDTTSFGDVIVGNTITNSRFDGLDLSSNDNTIGAVGHPNVISNCADGIGLWVYGGNNNTIVKNTVTGAAVTIQINGNDNTVQANTASQSYYGATIAVSGNGNLIGGYSVGDGNIVNALSTGIDPGSDSNVVLGNLITTRPGAVGIATEEDQAAPVLSCCAQYGNTLAITGQIFSTPFSNVRVELFASAPQKASAGSVDDEGQVFLGFVNVQTDGSGMASLADDVSYKGMGKVITATATANGNSSGFSGALQVSEGN